MGPNLSPLHLQEPRTRPGAAIKKAAPDGRFWITLAFLALAAALFYAERKPYEWRQALNILKRVEYSAVSMPPIVKPVVKNIPAGVMICSAQNRAGGGRLEVVSDMRIELLGVLWRRTASPKDGPEPDPYRRAVDQHFASLGDHEAVKHVSKLLCSARDRTTALALFRECLETTLKVRADPPPLCAASPLLGALPDFIARSGFVAFYRSRAAMFEHDAETVRAGLRPPDPYGEFERYTGVKPSWGYTIVPSRLLPDPDPGWEAAVDSVCRAEDRWFWTTAVTGGSSKDGTPRFTTDRLMWGVMVFNAQGFHARIQGLLGKHQGLRRRLEPVCENDWKKCVTDLIVVALADRLQPEGVAPPPSFAMRASDKAAALRASLAQALGEYEGNRAGYRTFSDFIPRLLLVMERALPEASERAPAPKAP